MMMILNDQIIPMKIPIRQIHEVFSLLYLNNSTIFCLTGGHRGRGGFRRGRGRIFQTFLYLFILMT